MQHSPMGPTPCTTTASPSLAPPRRTAHCTPLEMATVSRLASSAEMLSGTLYISVPGARYMNCPYEPHRWGGLADEARVP